MTAYTEEAAGVSTEQRSAGRGGRAASPGTLQLHPRSLQHCSTAAPRQMVDCSYGLHPWRDMEPEEKLCRQELDLLRDTFMEFESVTRSTTVPDICDTLFSSSSDCFGQHVDENFDCDELLSSFVAGEAGALELESSDPLRHDCMWSGLGPADTDTRNILRRWSCKPSIGFHSRPLLNRTFS